MENTNQKPIESMTTAEMMEELRQRREYDSVLEPQLERMGAMIEAQGTELAVLRAIMSGQITAAVMVSGMIVPTPNEEGPQA